MNDNKERNPLLPIALVGGLLVGGAYVAFALPALDGSPWRWVVAACLLVVTFGVGRRV